jgi:Family of unknown function (DUF5996)
MIDAKWIDYWAKRYLDDSPDYDTRTCQQPETVLRVTHVSGTMGSAAPWQNSLRLVPIFVGDPCKGWDPLSYCRCLASFRPWALGRWTAGEADEDPPHTLAGQDEVKTLWFTSSAASRERQVSKVARAGAQPYLGPRTRVRRHDDGWGDRRAAARMFWQQLMQAHRVIGQLRASFVGKVSFLHFFWGATDLACTRFSGRPAPKHPGGVPNCADWVMVEAYSHELSSCGFWPGGREEGAFYCYAYPKPDGFTEYPIASEAAYFSREIGEFVLPYEAVGTADDPDGELLQFLQTTYAAAADLGSWDRAALEVDPARWRQR